MENTKNKDSTEYDKEPVLTEEQEEKQKKAIQNILNQKEYKKIRPLRWFLNLFK